MTSVFIKNQKWNQITDTDMLLMVEKGIRRGICHAIHPYATANNKYMRHHKKDKESPCIMYWDANNLYGWPMSQKLPVDNFKWKENTSKFDKKFIKSYDENSDTGHILEEDVEYPKDLHELHNDLPFLPERIKVKKCHKLVCYLYDKEKYVGHIATLKQALNHGLLFKERCIE